MTGWLLAAFLAIAGISQPAQELRNLPESVCITQGYSFDLRLSLPFCLETDSSAVGVLSTAETVDTIAGHGAQICADAPGEANVTLRLMGILPVKTMSVSVTQEKMLIPGGGLIGVAMRTQGVLLVGTSDVGGAASPARTAGLRSGDSILRADGVPIQSAQQLSETVAASQGREIALTVQRAGSTFERSVLPRQDERDGAWRLGAWVRDSTAGVGTLSFIDPQNGSFGALGHAISDIDTQTHMLLGEGDIYEGTVADIHRGEAGSPGEIVGSFFDGEQYLGSIRSNTDFGVFGAYVGTIDQAAVPIMTRSEVRTGSAVIYSQVGSEGVRAYDCEITRITEQDSPSQRGLVLRITDPELLERTGGIVQGMSGSPILQNGRLVGAVTHVFVNDPTQGYGIFIEWMLDAAG